uniref:Histone chaperone domain-containing protein n=1 Tax=Knipowitschia caucasica TaxID=637954 RepID=A0AAV2KGP5_KNICA
MTVTEKESQNIRKFVCSQLRDEPDLSSLTIGVLKQRYLQQVSAEALSSEAKHFMKEVVKEELARIMDNENSPMKTESKTPSKRKREGVSEWEESASEAGDSSRAKRSRHESGSAAESEDKNSHMASDCSEDKVVVKKKKMVVKQKKTVTSSDDSEDEVPRATAKREKPNGRKTNAPRNSKKKPVREGSVNPRQDSSEESEEEKGHQDNASVKTKKNVGKKESDDGSDEMEAETSLGKSPRKDNSNKSASSESDGEKNTTLSKNTSKEQDDVSSDGSEVEGKKQDEENAKSQSDSEDDSCSDHSRKNGKKDASSNKSAKENGAKGKVEEPDSDSSSLPSLDDDTDYKKEKKERPSVVKEKGNKKEKKSTGGSQIFARLNKELEDLGVKGTPTIEKCKKARKKRERAQELSELDTSNIITGRPKRQAALPWHRQRETPASTFQRTLDSDSDSDQQQSHKVSRKTNWNNLQGIISDGGESD